MKRYFFIIFLLSTMLTAQSDWNQTWKMATNPFQPPQSLSGMHIVKAGFDTDNDGWGEFIASICDKDSNFVMMYEASADNTYELVWSWKFPYRANSYNGIAVGDADNNGIIEILVTQPTNDAGISPPRLWIFEWNGVDGENKYGNYSTGICEPHGTWNYDLEDGIDFRPMSLMVEDIDQDGKNELITGVRGEPDRNVREIIVSSVTGTFTVFANWNIEFRTENEGGALYSVTTGDLDGDGNREIHGLLWDLFTLRIYEATGPDTYELQSEIIELDPNIDYGAWDGVGVTDVNNDGTNEMYIAGMNLPGDNYHTLFFIEGEADNGTIDDSDVKVLMELSHPEGGGFNNIEICDPDGDGNLSLMLAGRYTGLVYDIEYKGTGDPANSSSWDVSVAYDIFATAAADLGISADSALSVISPRIAYGSYGGDMDNDGKNEYVFVNYSSDFEDWSNDAYVFIIENGTTLAISSDNNSIPTHFTLNQNYPNPFNPQTVISYSLNESSFINLTVYDMLGKNVRTLINESKNSGDYSIIWDGLSDDGLPVSSGLYYYKLKSNGTQISKSMVLIR